MASWILVLSLAFILVGVGTSSAVPTAYDVLVSYGFPEGLLPKTVKNSGENYDLKGNGAFELHLERPCRFTIPGNYEVKYDSRIAGVIDFNHLRSLSGISVRYFHMWWNIDAISVNGKDLHFQVGRFSSNFPADNFDENPMCTGSGGGHADH
ncbi:hypothetical protein KP509_34G004300 [Ceratopteris richardii]|uniref:Uncharacterized protein n=1 Tax=Ceratopteris richardii TaxID=49495 RepID=A0A8T2QJ07_CERRI|nr:hypothetical protein KP509_34G004300 [Ceratopteris richardii]